MRDSYSVLVCSLIGPEKSRLNCLTINPEVINSPGAQTPDVEQIGYSSLLELNSVMFRGMVNLSFRISSDESVTIAPTLDFFLNSRQL